MTPESLRSKGFVEGPPGYWTKPKNLGAGAADRANNTQLARTPKRLRQSTKPLMNKLETEYCAVLESIWSIVFKQAVRFRLGNGIWYKPDFFVMDAQIKPIAVEVKGPHAFRGGFENLKVAASLYPQIKWLLVWKQDGQWQEQEILP